MKRIGGHQERVGVLALYCSEGAVEPVRTAYRGWEQLQAQRRCRNLQRFEMWRMRGIIRIPKKDHARDERKDLLDKLQPLGGNVRAEDGIACDIPARPGEACREPGPYRITDPDHDDGDRVRRRLARGGGWRALGYDDIHWDADQFCCRGRKPVGLALGSTILKGDVLTLDVTQAAQPSAERVPGGRIIDDADPRNLNRQLCSRQPRPRSR